MVTSADLEARGATPLDEFVWEAVDVLRPGTDFRNGQTYVTFPMLINVKKTVGKGKAAHEEYVPERGIGCIRSDGKRFAFTPERVQDFGFGYPQTVTTPDTQRWSLNSMKEFVDGETTPVNPVALYDGIRTVYEKYIEFADENYYDMMTLFVMGSYHFRLFPSTGYVHFNGTAASGKSQNLNILAALGFNTIWSSNMSTASLYRTMSGAPGLICIDEAEGFDGERGEDLRRILNAGYTDGSKVQRTEKGPNDQFIVVSYDCYGPKALASIIPLEAVIASRCVIVAMRPALRTIPTFDRMDPEWQTIRDRLYIWMMAEQPAIKALADQWNELTRYDRAPGLRARHWQITQLYIILADYLDTMDKGGRCDKLIAFFTNYFSEREKQQDATDRIRLVLRTLPRVLATANPHDIHFYPLKTIHEVVSQYLEDDQKDYFKTRTLGKYLDVLGFKTRRAHKQGQQVWIEPAQVRQEFLQRRVEPDPDDEAWLRGEVEYNLTPAITTQPTPKEPDDIWASYADTQEN